jgi:GNAT superfamily N-acetyltransferase
MDEITKRWFDASTVRVVRAPELGGWHSDEELVRLSGAPKGSQLQVRPLPDGKIELTVVNQDLLSEPLVRHVWQVEHVGYVFEIQNKSFVLRPKFRGMGIGPRSVAIELHEAHRLGYFSKVVVSAVGDWHHRNGPFAMNGYYVWAKMGFDGPLPKPFLTHPALPQACADSRSIAELFRTEEGKDFWFRYGTSIDLEFALQEPSASWERYRRFALDEDIKVTV